MNETTMSRRMMLEAGMCAVAAAATVPLVAGAREESGLSPGSEQAIRKYYAASIASSKAAGTTTTIGNYLSGVSGNMGWSSGTFKDTGPGGGTVDTGKFLSTWRKTDGKWFQVRDIFNMDPPPPEAAVPAQLPK